MNSVYYKELHIIIHTFYVHFYTDTGKMLDMALLKYFI